MLCQPDITDLDLDLSSLELSLRPLNSSLQLHWTLQKEVVGRRETPRVDNSPDVSDRGTKYMGRRDQVFALDQWEGVSSLLLRRFSAARWRGVQPVYISRASWGMDVLPHAAKSLE